MRKTFLITSAVSLIMVVNCGLALAQGPGEIPDSSEIESEINRQIESEIPDVPTGEIGPLIDRPAVPGIPAEARTLIPDGDFVEIYCLMTKWKAGDFLAALDALDRYLVPAVRESEEITGDLDMPDIISIRSEVNSKITGLCAATTVESANEAVQDIVAYGETVRNQFSEFRNVMSAKLKAKGDALREKIESGIKPMVEDEKAKAEAELNALGERLGDEAQRSLESEMSSKTFSSGEEAQAYVQGRIGPIKSGISSQIQARANELRVQIEARIRAEVDRIAGSERVKFEELGAKLNRLGADIDAGIQSGKAEYEKFRIAAFSKRQSLVMDIVDRSLADAEGELEKNRKLIDEARVENPEIKSVDDVISEMKADRSALVSGMARAMNDGDESAFQAAIDGFRGKWENYRAETEKSFYSVSAICAKASGQFASVRTQMEQGFRQITELQDRCGEKLSEECQKVNELAPRFSTLTSKMTAVVSRISAVDVACQNPDATDPESLIGLLNQVKADGDDLKAFGQSLEAEKTRIIADSMTSLCASVLPQLQAAKVELETDDLTAIDANIIRCRGQQTEECVAINSVVGQVNNLKSAISVFKVDAAKVESTCTGVPDEGKFMEVRDLAEFLRSEGEKMRLQAKELRQRQAEAMSMKAICPAVTSKMEIAKQEIVRGMDEARTVQSSCEGKTDGRCAAINSAGDRFASINGTAEVLMGKIASVIGECRSAGDEAISADFMAQLESIRSGAEEFRKQVDELKGIGNSQWSERIKTGKPFRVIFDVAPSIFDDKLWTGDWRTDPMGTIRGGDTYTLAYSEIGWLATGYNEGTKGVGSWTYRYGDPERNQLDIWGRIYEFDSDGNVYDSTYGLVGHLAE